MGETKRQIQDFIDKCEQLKSCKFIMATTKIKDLLKCIAKSESLYLLFKEVTADYDYIAAKQKYLLTSTNGIITKSYVVLPETAGECLAFIFCLLVEFDRDALNFNGFLQKYYAVDGSYFASYHQFCDEIIDTLEDIIRAVFESELAEEEAYAAVADFGADPQTAQIVARVGEIVSAEQNALGSCPISDDEKQEGVMILSELYNALKVGNVRLVGALLSGYHYYVLCQGVSPEGLSVLVSEIGNLEKIV